jgi:hypothetical protein
MLFPEEIAKPYGISSKEKSVFYSRHGRYKRDYKMIVAQEYFATIIRITSCASLEIPNKKARQWISYMG